MSDLQERKDNGHSRNSMEAVSDILNFLKREPLYLTVQGYSDAALDDTTLGIINDHISSWTNLLAKHGLDYRCDILDGRDENHVDLVIQMKLSIDREKSPALPYLVLDALYELTTLLPGVEWHIHSVEQVVTKLEPDSLKGGMSAGQRTFGQIIQGSPSDEEADTATVRELEKPPENADR